MIVRLATYSPGCTLTITAIQSLLSRRLRLTRYLRSPSSSAGLLMCMRRENAESRGHRGDELEALRCVGLRPVGAFCAGWHAEGPPPKAWRRVPARPHSGRLRCLDQLIEAAWPHRQQQQDRPVW